MITLPVYRLLCAPVVIIALLFIVGSTPASATPVEPSQIVPRDTTYTITTNDGNTFTGKLVTMDSVQVILRTRSIGLITISRSSISTMTRVYGTERFAISAPNSTRYIFGPSAIPLQKGEGYYQSLWTLQSLQFGITDNISIGGGVELFTLVTGYPIFYLTPKVSFPIAHNLYVGAGVLYITAAAIDADIPDLGITYGIVTLGDPDLQVTGGAGWGFVGGDFSSSPILTLSGLARLSEHFALITENWFIPDGRGKRELVMSLGGRLLWQSIAFDISFANTAEGLGEVFPGLPILSFTARL